MSERKIYTLAGVQYVCGELTLRQDQHAMGIIARAGAGDLIGVLLDMVMRLADSADNDKIADQDYLQKAFHPLAERELDFKPVFTAIADQGLLEEFIATVIFPTSVASWQKTQLEDNTLLDAIGNMKRAQYWEVLKDFLSQNFGWLQSDTGSSEMNGTVRMKPKTAPPPRKRASKITAG